MMERKKVVTKIKSIGTRSRKITQDIQVIGLECMEHFGEHGDTSLASMLVNQLSNGARKEALIAWFKGFGAMKWYEKEKVFKKDSKKALDIAGAQKNPWNIFTTEKPVSEWDINKAIDSLNRLIKRVENNLPPEQRDMFKEAVKKAA